MNQNELHHSIKSHRDEIPVNNTPRMAQWFIERGKDKKGSGWGYIVACCVTPLIVVLPLLLPFFIIQIREGNRLIATGEAMNEAAGRSNVFRPADGERSTRFMRGHEASPGGRYDNVSEFPPEVPLWA